MPGAIRPQVVLEGEEATIGPSPVAPQPSAREEAPRTEGTESRGFSVVDPAEDRPFVPVTISPRLILD